MKKRLAIILSVLLVFTLTACHPADEKDKTKDSEAASTTTEATLSPEGLEEGELPLLRPDSDTKGKDSSGGSDSETIGSEKKDSESKQSDDSSSVEQNNSGNKSDSSKSSSSKSELESKTESTTESKKNQSNEPTIPPEINRYIEENGDELPFVPA